MRRRTTPLLFSLSFLAAARLPAQDPYCPKYPASERVAARDALSAERLYASVHARAVAGKAAAINLPRANFIDNFLFDKMAADGVAPAPVTNDAEFLRRASLDLTGRIPTPEAARAFLANTNAKKREQLIDQLLASDAYAAQWTLYFANRFRVTRGGISRVGLERRNAFHKYLRDFIQRDRPYNAVVREMLTASGDADQTPASGFLIRIFSDINNGPIQDFYDNLTDIATTQFLGFKTECISCHNGRGYLEKINLYLTRKRRADFWATSAFFSRLQVLDYNDRDFSVRRFYFIDRDTGTYVGTVNPDNPGMRPPRTNSTVEKPVYLLNQAEASTDAWRQDFVQLITGDRQFARAAVNYMWAYFFRAGIVDPPNGWDLMRVDPKNPPPGDWPVQNTHPELLEALTDYFIQNNYSVKALLRLMANSTAWQLSSRYDGAWKADYARYFARHTPRRLAAEEVFDAVTAATQTDVPMTIAGFDAPLSWANELPDPVEPANDFRVQEFLKQFGRGNWTDTERDNSPNLLGLLYAMNGWEITGRTLEATWMGNPTNRITRLGAVDAPDEEVVRTLFLATLTREPTAAELAAVMARRAKNQRAPWLGRVQWALINKLDFIFNY